MSQIKVLMVDDEKRFRDTTKKILNGKGFETILADSGEDALAKMDQAPDVVILDIKMPGMDGHETLAKIKEINPHLPVIMLTGHGAMPSAKEALAGGAFDYLSKPCDINLLAEKIKEAHHLKDKNKLPRERSVADIMIPIAEYSTIREDKSVKEAVIRLKRSFITQMATSRLMETGHRSILVVDSNEQVKGILTIRDLMEMVMPGYLSAPKPSLADSIEYSPMFWKGMFTMGIQQMGNTSLSQVMSPSPASIDGQANLMEAAYLMLEANQRRLIVTISGKTGGIIREQELFFEMERLII
ncbi:CBS domain-containing protein [Desulfocicer vacuolatum DSM 3385]|uniref:CBS domain-containing protein n=1 Tax=Desulfocicer vacuolatum DSM 3385 TaxID=1121400 RepID=A0A1W1YTS0_9BACT|nr:response regulator [Desulfocicer vacuolatum]SMC39607.1 CBS domain-containing protein [Desulfocicer vacuolatum DSM 3385]